MYLFRLSTESNRRNPPGKREAEPADAFGFEDTATSLGIPREQWRDPTMQTFIRLLVNHVGNLQIEADDASLAASLDVSRWPRSETARQYVETTNLESNLRDRHASVELLLRAAEAVLTDGRHGKDPLVEDPNDLQAKRHNAAARYGLRVVRESEER